MKPSAALYAKATDFERAAGALQHTDPAAAAQGKLCEGGCRRCRLEARARVHGRAGDAAAALEADEVERYPYPQSDNLPGIE